MKGNEVRLGNYCREITHSKNHVVKVSKEHFEDMEDNENRRRFSKPWS